MLNDNLDWRLLNIKTDLQGQEFCYTKFKSNGRNDHEHCILCWQTISDDVNSGDNEGYYFFNKKTNQTNWICKTCFEEFKNRFDWQVKHN